MARVVGDDGAGYPLCDMAVYLDHQGHGLGTRLLDAVMAYLDEHAPEAAYISLMADVDRVYEQ